MAESPWRNTGRPRGQPSHMDIDEDFARTPEGGPAGQQRDSKITFDNTRQLLELINSVAILKPGVEMEIGRATNLGCGTSSKQTDSELQTKLRQSEEDNRKLREENESLRMILNNHAQDKQNWHNTEVSKSKKELEEIIRSAETENRQLKDKLQESNENIDAFKKRANDAFSDLKDKCKKAASEAQEERRAKEENQKLLKVKADKVEEMKQAMAKQSEEINSKSEEMRKDKNQLMQLRKELDETKSRLSKMMGHQMKDGNPYVTDLSDKNRPTKLAEVYTELYDNEWTDAFDVLSNSGVRQDEKHTVQQLHDILLNVNKFCQVEAEQQTEQLKHGLLEGCKPGKTVPESTLRQLKEIIRSNSECGLDELYEKYKQDNTSRRSVVAYIISRVPDYVKKCLYVCWFMTLQDPALVFKVETGSCQYFNKDIYKAFTKTGSYIDYIVWPPLLLHAGGPLLAKGVAQCFLSSNQHTKSDSLETSSKHGEKGLHNEPKQAWAATAVTTVSGSLPSSLTTSVLWTQSPTNPTYAGSGDGTQVIGTYVTTPSTIGITAEADRQWYGEGFQANAEAYRKVNKNSSTSTSRSRNNYDANHPSSRLSGQTSNSYNSTFNFLPEYSRGGYYHN